MGNRKNGYRRSVELVVEGIRKAVERIPTNTVFVCGPDVSSCGEPINGLRYFGPKGVSR